MSSRPRRPSRPAFLDDPDQPGDPERAEFERLLAASDSGPAPGGPREPAPGERVEGKVLAVGAETVFLDLGGGLEGILDTVEVRDLDGEVTVSVGDPLVAVVVGRDPGSRAFLLRRRGGGRPGEVGPELRQAKEMGLPVEGIIRGVVKGGFEVELAGQRAFCPVSQIAARPVAEPEALVGQRLAFLVTRVEEGGRGRSANVVVSRRELLEREARERAAAVRATLAPGAVVRGRVTSLASYGAFVDLGGIEGMIHTSELGHTRVASVEDVLAVGDEVEVQVLRIEPPREGRREERIALSIKALQRDPWKDAALRFPVGSEHPGRVMRLESFGAFVEVAPGLEGLVHVSELGEGRRLNHAREALQLGEDLVVRVADVDETRRRLSLTLLGTRHAGTGEEAEWRAHLARERGSFGTLGELLRNREKQRPDE
ncbi:MAG: S1 RNA-binding domain-containing protein [Acidobacteriota bacterium]|nr:S1 RNA-binding domain-containing protein [Acidobacteriota bacterium]